MLRQDYKSRIKEVQDAITILEAQGKEKFSAEINSLKIKLLNIEQSEDFNRKAVIAIACVSFVFGVLAGVIL